MTTWDDVIAACEASLARWSAMPFDGPFEGPFDGPFERLHEAGDPVPAMAAPRTAPSPEQQRQLADLLRRTEATRRSAATRRAEVADELEAVRERRRARRAYSGDGAA